MQYIKFYNVRAHSTNDIASLVDSPLVPTDDEIIPSESTESILIPEMKKSQSAIIDKLTEETTDKRDLLSAKLVVNDHTTATNLRLQIRVMETDKPSFIFHFIKRSNKHLLFIETMPNKYNIHDNSIILRGFEHFKDSRWTYIHYAEKQMRCTLKPQLYNVKTLYLNAITSPYVDVNFCKVTSYNGMFSGMKELEEIVIEKFDTTNITSMEEMFSGCVKLKTIKFIGCDFSSVETMANLCNGCVSLKKLQFIDCKLHIRCDYWNILYNCPEDVSLTVPMEIYNVLIQ